jgi:hypothetical protein
MSYVQKSRIELLREIDGLHDDHLVSCEHAAAYLGLSVGNLANWRCTKRGGPAFVRQGRVVRYRMGALKAWISARTETIAA